MRIPQNKAQQLGALIKKASESAEAKETLGNFVRVAVGEASVLQRLKPAVNEAFEGAYPPQKHMGEGPGADAPYILEKVIPRQILSGSAYTLAVGSAYPVNEVAEQSVRVVFSMVTSGIWRVGLVELAHMQPGTLQQLQDNLIYKVAEEVDRRFFKLVNEAIDHHMQNYPNRAPRSVDATTYAYYLASTGQNPTDPFYVTMAPFNRPESEVVSVTATEDRVLLGARDVFAMMIAAFNDALLPPDAWVMTSNSYRGAMTWTYSHLGPETFRVVFYGLKGVLPQDAEGNTRYILLGLPVIINSRFHEYRLGTSPVSYEAYTGELVFGNTYSERKPKAIEISAVADASAIGGNDLPTALGNASMINDGTVAAPGNAWTNSAAMDATKATWAFLFSKDAIYHGMLGDPFFKVEESIVQGNAATAKGPVTTLWFSYMVGMALFNIVGVMRAAVPNLPYV